MAGSKQPKRKRSRCEDYDSCSDFEEERKKNSDDRNSKKKKKVFIESESESDSSIHSSEIANNTHYEDEKCETSSDDDEPLTKLKSASVPKENSKKVSSSSEASDDEPLAIKQKNSLDCSKVIESEENRHYASSDDEPLSNICKALNENSKKMQTSSDSSDAEPLATKQFMKNKFKKQTIRHNASSDDKTLLNGTCEATDEKSEKEQNASNSSDDEPLATKQSIKNNSKSKNGHISSDEDEPLINIKKTSSKKSAKTKNSTNDRIERLKKYLRLSGIRINSYDKLFADCKSVKAKTEKLLSILHEKGMKGQPTIEKCKKLRVKIETKKEISELDTSNIIKKEGRPKRGSDGIETKTVENSPAKKRFSRLKDIIDSEESD